MEHKFFVRDIDANLESLMSWTIDLDNSIRSGKLELEIPQEMLSIYKDRPSGAGTALLSYYNIFDMGNPDIEKLKNGIKSALLEACEYYGIDYASEEWYVHGWFNRNAKDDMWDVSPIDHEEKWHEHMGGVGAPVFHGYYCVNAEPSVTVYQVFKNPDNIKVNVNKNNRLVVSETGHPHGMGNWRSDEQRITLAYDIAPKSHIGQESENWTRIE